MTIYRFGDYELDVARRELSAGGASVALEPQVFSLIHYLIEERGRVVGKDDLIEEVWQGRVVSDAALNTRINAARRALGDTGKDQAVIRTFPRRGFRFVAEVEEVETDGDTGNRAAMALPDNPSIVVLPFKNLSDDPEQEYFSDGITEDVTTALGRIRWLFVIARNSAFAYKNQAGDVREVARDLGVRYVVEGSVRKSGDRVRISAQLVDGATGRQVWGNRYDETLADIFDLQDRITETIIGAIEPELGRAEQERARSKKPGSLDAWDLYQRGMWHLYRRTRGDLSIALDYFARAQERDPGLSQAHSGSVDAYYYTVVLGLSDDAAADRESALDHARRAIEADPSDAFAHNAMGKARIVRREHDAALPELELALELNPSLAWAHYGIGAATVFSGRDAAEAVRHLESAVRLSPRDAHMASFMVRMADAHLALGDYETAATWATRALREPGFQWSRYTVLAAALGHLGRAEEASKRLDELAHHGVEATIAFVREWHLYRDTPTFDHYLEGLRKAGAS